MIHPKIAIVHFFTLLLHFFFFGKLICSSLLISQFFNYLRLKHRGASAIDCILVSKVNKLGSAVSHWPKKNNNTQLQGLSLSPSSSFCILISQFVPFVSYSKIEGHGCTNHSPRLEEGGVAKGAVWLISCRLSVVFCNQKPFVLWRQRRQREPQWFTSLLLSSCHAWTRRAVTRQFEGGSVFPLPLHQTTEIPRIVFLCPQMRLQSEWMNVCMCVCVQMCVPVCGAWSGLGVASVGWMLNIF